MLDTLPSHWLRAPFRPHSPLHDSPIQGQSVARTLFGQFRSPPSTYSGEEVQDEEGRGAPKAHPSPCRSLWLYVVLWKPSPKMVLSAAVRVKGIRLSRKRVRLS
jgi:hypothetical protein